MAGLNEFFETGMAIVDSLDIEFATNIFSGLLIKGLMTDTKSSGTQRITVIAVDD